MKIPELLGMFVVAVLITSCSSEFQQNGGLPVLNRIETALYIVDSENGKPLTEVTAGTPVRLVLELKNLSDETLNFNFSSGKQYDFEVDNADKQMVWSWSQDKFFTQALSTLTLGPKETVKFAQNWDQKDNAGRQVPAGVYRVTGMLTTIGSESIKSSTKELVIK